MAQEQSPAFQFYFKDWRSSKRVSRMSFKERGMYLEMLIDQWDQGPLPLEPSAIADLIGAKATEFIKSWPTLRACFEQTSDGWVNRRLEAERTKQATRRIRAAEIGVDGARGKWGEPTQGTPATRGQRLSAARARGSHTEDEWNRLLVICGNKCVKCGLSADELHGGRLQKDHIRPIYQGGDDSISNLQPMCRNCNSAKGSDATDHRRAIPGMPAEWLATANGTPGNGNGTPGFSLSLASASAIASASAESEKGKPADQTDETITQRAGSLLERYAELYTTHRHGAVLPLIPSQVQFSSARSLVRLWKDPRLEKLAVLVLTTDDGFISNTDRSFKIFAMKAGWADNRLCEWEMQRGKAV